MKLILSLILISCFYSLSAQQNEMLKVSPNYESFTEQSTASLFEKWELYNSPNFYNHPEFGILPNNSPCIDCVEDLSKRTFNEKYFISTKKPSEFYKQKSYGAINFYKNGFWLTIDERLRKVNQHIYVAENQIDPTGINTRLKNSFIKTPFGNIQFNQWELFGIKQNQKVHISNSNWNNYTIGENGILITNIFNGIDLELNVSRGSIKSNFIIRQNNFSEFESLLFEDTFSSNLALFLNLNNSENKLKGIGEISIENENYDKILEIGMALIYPKGYEKEKSQFAEYVIEKNKIGINVPMKWIIENLKEDTYLIIDPVVTSSNTLAQASITGSGYNPTCFNGFCTYNLAVPTPANSSITNVQWSFSYRAQSSCYRNEGAVSFLLGSCRSPVLNNYFWFCNVPSAGDCTGNNISIFNDISACLPAPSCNPQILNFVMRFHRCWSSQSGCSNSCIGAITPWTMTITGVTLEYSNSIPISLNNTTICQGGSINATTQASYGVPPYNYSWSLNSNMNPLIGSGNSLNYNFTNAGTYTIYSMITDACGNSINSSGNITVNPLPAVNINPNPQTICSSQGTDLNINSTLANTNYTWVVAMSGVGGGTNGNGSGTGSNSSLYINQILTNNNNTPGTATYTITPSALGCIGLSSQVNVTVNPVATVNNPGNQQFCTGQNTSLIPLISTNGAIVNWTNNNTSTGLSATGVSAINSFIGQNSGTTNNVSTVIISPIYANCPGIPQSFTITITPNPNLNLPNSQTICSGASTNTINFTGNANSYSWTNTNPAIGLSTNGSGDIPSFVGINTGTSTISGTIYVTPFDGSCNGATQSFQINIVPNIIPTFSNNGPYCINSTPGLLLLNSMDTPPISGTWNPPTISTSTVGSQVYTFSPTAGQCASTIQTTITVNLTPSVSLSCSNICNGATTTVVATATPSGNYNYVWTVPSGANPGNVSSFLSGATGVYSVYITDTTTNCVSPPDNCTISIQSQPSVILLSPP